MGEASVLDHLDVGDDEHVDVRVLDGEQVRVVRHHPSVVDDATVVEAGSTGCWLL